MPHSTHAVSEAIAERKPSRALALTLAYLAVLPASSAHVIFFRVALGVEPPSWFVSVNLSLLGVLLALGWTVPALRPLRGYFLGLLMLTVGELLAIPAYAAFENSGWMTRMFANTAIELLIPSAFLAASAFLSGLGPRDIFLRKGDMAAESALLFGLRVSWKRLGTWLCVVLAAGLLPSAGATHAMVVTSVFFGLEHWFGHPSGPSGVLLAAFAGYVWAKSMVETRGFAWPWLMHFVQDVVIVSFMWPPVETARRTGRSTCERHTRMEGESPARPARSSRSSSWGARRLRDRRAGRRCWRTLRTRSA